jgi:AraC-like DNA-binding protein
LSHDGVSRHCRVAVLSRPLISTACISDPDQLVGAVHGAVLDPCQLSTSPAPSTLSRLLLPDACLDLIRLGPAMLFTGEMPQDCYTMMFVLGCPKPGHAFNFSMSHSDGYVGFWTPGTVLDASTPAGYANATLTVPVAEFHAAVTRNYPEIPQSVLTRGAGVRVGPVEQAVFRSLLAEVEDAIRRRNESLESALVLSHVQNDLLAVFLSALRSGCTNGEPPPAPRAGGRVRRMRQAREFIAAHVHEPLCLDDLCTALNLSRRGVENLFQDLLGINPITYLRHQRLHGVRRALSECEPGWGVVKEKALLWGFRHLGRFASDYREFFGELPAETLERKTRRS